jgi:hypothetical protein
MMPLWVFLIILVPRVLISLPAFWDLPRFIRPDSLDYVTLASNLWRHGVFSQSPAAPFFPEGFRLPGYPFFIGIWTTALHLPLAVVIGIQCVLGVGSVWLMWKWLSGITSRPRAIAGTLVFALDPIILFHMPLLLAEGLFLFLIVAAAYATW